MKNSYITFLLLIILSACGNSTQPDGNLPVINDSLSADTIDKTRLLEINEALKENPNDAALFLKRSEIYAAQNMLAQAIQDINRAIKLDSLNENYHVLKGDLFVRAGDGSMAEKSYIIATKINENNPEGYIKLAELMYYGERYNDMLKYANEALKRDMYNDRAYFNKGYAFLNLGDTAKAVSSFQTAVEQNNEFYDAYIILGYLMTLQKNPLGKDYFENALRIKPNDYQAKYNLAYFYQETGEYNKAIELYSELTQKFPNIANPYFNLGFIHLMYLHVYDVALDYFNKVLEIEPRNYKALFNRGYCKELTGNITGAEQDYKKTLEINPTFTPAALALERFDKKQYHTEPKK